MRVLRHDSATSFLEAAGPFLESDEARNNLPLATARACRDEPGRYPGPNVFAVAEEGGRVTGVALRTAPYHIQYYAPSAAAAAAADAFADVDLPGVHGPSPEAGEFARAWGARRGVAIRHGKRLRSWRLDAPIPAPPTPGSMRPGAADDFPLVAAWFRAFEEEAVHGMPRADAEDVARRTLEAGRVRLWEDGGRPVAMAGFTRGGPSFSRVGPVYTPPEARRRGFATALTGALSAGLLAEGSRCCYLFTDVANPTSNSIYGKVGYRPVADFEEWEFGGGGRPPGAGGG